MARGGYRPGAGRPKGARGKKTVGALPSQVKRAARKAAMTPLEYMLDVLNDPDVEPARRDRMAIAAAPYQHPRAGEIGKKESAADAARNVVADAAWGDDLAVPMSGARPN